MQGAAEPFPRAQDRHIIRSSSLLGVTHCLTGGDAVFGKCYPFSEKCYPLRKSSVDAALQSINGLGNDRPALSETSDGRRQPAMTRIGGKASSVTRLGCTLADSKVPNEGAIP